MRTDELDYDLPPGLIAQRPTPARDGARLLVLGHGGGALRHATVRDLPQLFAPSLLVVNDTRVIPARLRGRKRTGGRVEVLLIRRLSPPGREERWTAMARASKGLAAGAELQLGGGALSARVVARGPRGALELHLVAKAGPDAAPCQQAGPDVSALLARVGEVPLPPYIRRAPEPDDRARYQTVFAERPGAVAAPTAGLHLSHALLAALDEAGHRLARITLHVGPGTFAPVRADDLSEHSMHSERWEVPEDTAASVTRARAEGRPVVAVGTTVVRTLESAVGPSGELEAGSGETDLFIRPPYEARLVDGLLTNFHLPRSTLLALVMAFGGVDPVRAAYREAVRARYRFFSYGDAMLLAPVGR